MRLTKSNPTGGYSYLSDGVSPASDVLSDGYSAFTPGISEINGAGSRFYLADAQGNSRGLLDAGQGNPDGYNWDAFGNAVSRLGTNPTAYAWNEESGYQSDNDSGLKLLRHRYYDSWTGRFLSQDPAGDGDNWYAYCDNDPMNETDPSGLSSFFDPSKFGTAPGAGPSAWGDYNNGDPGTYDFFSGGSYTHSVTISAALNAAFTSTSGPMMGGGGMGGGMFAGPPNRGGGRLSPNEANRANDISSHMERLRRLALKKTGEAYEDKLKLPGHHDDELTNPSKSRYGHRVRLQRQIKAPWNALRAELKEILERAGIAGAAALDDLTIDFTGFGYFDPTLLHQKSYRGIDVTPNV